MLVSFGEKSTVFCVWHEEVVQATSHHSVSRVPLCRRPSHCQLSHLLQPKTQPHQKNNEFNSQEDPGEPAPEEHSATHPGEPAPSVGIIQ